MTVYQSSASDLLSASAVDSPATSETVAAHTRAPLAPTTPSHQMAFISMNPTAENAIPGPLGCSVHSNDSDSFAIQSEGRLQSSLSGILNPSPFEVNQRDYNVSSNTIQDQEQLDWQGYPTTAYLGPSLTDILRSSIASSTDHADISTEQPYPQF